MCSHGLAFSVWGEGASLVPGEVFSGRLGEPGDIGRTTVDATGPPRMLEGALLGAATNIGILYFYTLTMWQLGTHRQKVLCG